MAFSSYKPMPLEADIDLQHDTVVRSVGVPLMSGDNRGAAVILHVFDNGQPVNMAGTVDGVHSYTGVVDIVRADGVTVTVDLVFGSWDDINTIYAAIPAGAYYVPGRVDIYVRLTMTNLTTSGITFKRTIAWFQGTVLDSYTDKVDSNITPIPSAADLRVIQQACVQAQSAAAESAASAATSASSVGNVIADANAAAQSAGAQAAAAAQSAADAAKSAADALAAASTANGLPDAPSGVGHYTLGLDNGIVAWNGSTLIPLWTDASKELTLDTPVSFPLTEAVTGFSRILLQYNNAAYKGYIDIAPDALTYAFFGKAGSDADKPTLRSFGGAVSTTNNGRTIVLTARYGISFVYNVSTSAASMSGNGGRLTITGIYGVI